MSSFGSLENGNFHSLKRIVFYLEDPQSTFSALLCIKTNKKVQTFYQKWKFLWSSMVTRLVFYLKEPQATYLELICIKTNNKKISIFLPKSCVNPFEKCPVSGL